MEIDKLIEELIMLADTCEIWGTKDDEKLLRKAAEVIKLMRELIVEENNEKWHRMIDDIGDFNNGAEET